ncbi:MAG: TrkA family potassium uptake protein [Bifidobacteriaceae bacterium]|jgi:trk system potassium uptake protein TrkA|nr:TrkA family potassium uptake protein [Bifidobacteriaceae bacterium]
MKFIIFGSGHVGSNIANTLDEIGHNVSIIDSDPSSFRRLSSSFSGERIVGEGYNLKTLKSAGIEKAYGFVAVSSNDNTNFVSARIAKEHFNVNQVVAQVYNDKSEKLVSRFEIKTVSSFGWTANQVLNRLITTDGIIDYTDDAYSVSQLQFSVDSNFSIKTVSDFEQKTNAKISYIVRNGQPHIHIDKSKILENDIIHVTLHNDDIEKVKRMINV